MDTLERVIPFYFPDISEEKNQKILEALRSGWITIEPRTKQLKKLITNYVGYIKPETGQLIS